MRITSITRWRFRSKIARQSRWRLAGDQYCHGGAGSLPVADSSAWVCASIGSPFAACCRDCLRASLSRTISAPQHSASKPVIQTKMARRRPAGYAICLHAAVHCVIRSGGRLRHRCVLHGRSTGTVIGTEHALRAVDSLISVASALRLPGWTQPRIINDVPSRDFRRPSSSY